MTTTTKKPTTYKGFTIEKDTTAHYKTSTGRYSIQPWYEVEMKNPKTGEIQTSYGSNLLREVKAIIDYFITNKEEIADENGDDCYYIDENFEKRAFDKAGIVKSYRFDY